MNVCRRRRRAHNSIAHRCRPVATQKHDNNSNNNSNVNINRRRFTATTTTTATMSSSSNMKTFGAALLVGALLLVSGPAGVEAGKKKKETARAVKSDLKYVKCQVCQEVGGGTHTHTHTRVCNPR